MTGIRNYSPTASSNSSVGGVSIAEGMSRASVNNAMRAGYADLANLLLDLGGAKATTGSLNAYLLSLDSAPTAYANNLLFLARFNHTNTGASTIDVNGIGVADLKKKAAGTATALAAGDAPASGIGICCYSTADSAVILLNPANFSSPMTSRGDLIRGGVTGPERLALGASGQFLTSDGTDAIWAVLSGIVTSMFAANVVDTDPTLAANSNTRLAAQAAVKAYIDAASAGTNWATSGPVACATTANITLSGEQTLDGVLTSASRVLVKNQTAATANGIYVSAAGAWARATDADAGAEFIRLGVYVAAGTTQAGGQFICTRTTAPTLGVDNLVFTQFNGSAVYTAGTGLGLTGNQFNITDAELLALLALTSAADKLPYFSGSGTAALADFTSVARTLIAQTTQALMRTTGLGFSANGSSLVSAADYAAMRSLLLAVSGSVSTSDNAVARFDVHGYALDGSQVSIDDSGNLAAGGAVIAGGFRSNTAAISMTDDTATTISLSISTTAQGFLLISPNAATGGGGLFWFRVGTSPDVKLVSSISGGGAVAVTTGILTGTTGANSTLTISAHTNAKLYIENRIGTVSYNVSLLSLTPGASVASIP